MTSPSQMFSCVDAQSVFKSPLNTSTAKTQYSFCKSDRFKSPKPEERFPKFSSNTTYYNLPDNKSLRKTCLGLGKKTDLEYGKHPHNLVPSPNSYQIDTFVDYNRKHARGSSCHLGRNKVTNHSFVDLEKLKVPGPGQYEQELNRETPKWTMRPITNTDLFAKTTASLNPGPGAHEFNQVLNPEGQYYCSKYKSSGSKVWNPQTSSRFNQSTSKVPGAGAYVPRYTDLSNEGKYVMSHHKGTGKRRFSQSIRHSFVDDFHRHTKTPGPGSYRSPSDFGQYDEKKGSFFN